jgi:hypothetical protein
MGAIVSGSQLGWNRHEAVREPLIVEAAAAS